MFLTFFSFFPQIIQNITIELTSKWEARFFTLCVVINNNNNNSRNKLKKCVGKENKKTEQNQKGRESKNKKKERAAPKQDEYQRKNKTRLLRNCLIKCKSVVSIKKYSQSHNVIWKHSNGQLIENMVRKWWIPENVTLIGIHKQHFMQNDEELFPISTFLDKKNERDKKTKSVTNLQKVYSNWVCACKCMFMCICFDSQVYSDLCSHGFLTQQQIFLITRMPV